MTDLLKLPKAEREEAAVLGEFLVNPDSIDDYHDRLRLNDWGRIAHAVIYTAMMEVYEEGGTLDLLSVSSKLESRGRLEEVGGRAYLSELSDAPSFRNNLEAHVSKIIECSVRRQIILSAQRAAHSAHDPGELTADVLEEYQSDALKITTDRGGENAGAKTVEQLYPEVIKEIEAAERHDVTGIPTGFIDLDKLLCGLAPGDLVVLAARPSMGKSALGMQIAEFTAERGGKVEFFSLEMKRAQLMLRLLCGRLNLSLHAFRGRDTANDDLKRMRKELESIRAMPLTIDDRTDHTINTIRVSARRTLHAQKGIDLIVIDYVGLVRSTERGHSREQEVAAISMGAKTLAKEMNVPVILISQLNREVEKRADKRPMLADLRESGALEQDADVVIFLYRRGYYKKGLPDEERGRTEVIVAKQRQGPTGLVNLELDLRSMRFRNAVKN